jgi:chromosomal replication initiator protein
VVTVADVDAAMCSVLRLASGTLQSKSRAWTVTHPRMAAIYLCRKHTAATYGEIAKHFGAKTHSTAVAAEKKVRAWLDKSGSVAIGDRDWPVKELLDRVERELQR